MSAEFRDDEPAPWPPGYRSAENWVENGRRVSKGERSHARDDAGVALFHRKQTVYIDAIGPSRDYVGDGDGFGFGHWADFDA